MITNAVIHIHLHSVNYDLDNHRASVHYLKIMDEAKPSLLFK